VIAAAADITDEEADAIRASEEISDDQRHSMVKYKLRKCYNFQHFITDKFVSTYNIKRVQRNYKNLVRLFNGLDEIKVTETTFNSDINTLGASYHHIDINYRYVYDQHRYALGLLKMCGWTNINDMSYHHANEFNLDEYFKHIHVICNEFELRQLSVRDNLDSVIAQINKVLSIMYGMSIISLSKTNTYKLKANTKFTYDLRDTIKPVIR
jgi:hypothetical protein